ncbi:MAG: VCBS repeat-containing protein [Melioribacteraceae bacterium]|nr:VCBS repeat-containing protein [Melioribacteraceae bacterium]
MKKLLKEEKIDFRHGVKSKLFAFFVLLNSLLSAQVPLNGFVNLSKADSKILSGKLFNLDYNLDGYRDLIVFDSGSNKYSAIEGSSSNTNQKISSRYSPYQISAIIPFNANEKSRSYYFVSRKSRVLGIASFNKSGSINLRTTLKIESFPNFIDAADIDDDGVSEILTSGILENGLRTYKLIRNRIVLNQEISDRTFFKALFIDLDYDGYPDIAALDSKRRNLTFFYNDGTGNYYEYRSKSLSYAVNNFISEDIDFDNFTELIASNDNGFEILKGDSVSSFEKKIFITTKTSPEKFIVADFNSNGYNDFAYLDSSGSMYLIFSDNGGKYFPPIEYLSKENVINLESFIDRRGNNLSALSGQGMIFNYSSIKSMKKEFNISFGINPDKLCFFNYSNDRYSDLMIYDKTKQKAITILSDLSGIPNEYNEFLTASSHTKIKCDDLHSTSKTFYFYSDGGREIEILKINFRKGKTERKIIYTSIPIRDLFISRDMSKDYQSVYVLGIVSGVLVKSEFQFRNFRYVSTGSENIDVNAVTARFNPLTRLEIFSVNKKKQKYNFVRYSYQNSKYEKTLIKTVEENPEDKIYLSIFRADYNRTYTAAVAFVNDKNCNIALTSGRGNTEINLPNFTIDGAGLFLDFDLKRNVLSMFLKNIFDGEIVKFAYNKDWQMSKRISIFKTKEDYKFTLNQLNSRNTYLVYNIFGTNSVSFKEL